MTQQALPGVWPDHLETVENDLAEVYSYVREIARGRTGAAYLISRNDSDKQFCLKTISPAIPERLHEEVRDTLAKEAEILDPLHHRCIPTVYERSLTAKLPYYVCTFHAGKTFQEFSAEKERLSTNESVHVIWSLIDSLEYLHSKGRTHCDFHHKNILISKSIFAEGILIIDFGSGHRESDTTAGTKERGDLRYKPVESQPNYRKKVDRNRNAQSFAAADFSALGHLLGLMTDVFFSEARNDQRLSYVSICNQLRAGEISSWPDVKDAFHQVVDPFHLMSGAERFFVTEDGDTEAVRIPVSGEVPVGEAILAVINTTAFQRLRLINQLSFCDWCFPGGKHTRFEHSLGVMSAAREALSRLARDRSFHLGYTRLNFEGTLLASLVHDVGHYPFAHSMEHYVASRFSAEAPEVADKAKSIVSHAQHTIHILENDSELRDAIHSHWGPRHATEAIRILEGKVPVLSELIDGPIDCDKLDYIRRDAHHCGVDFGRGLDVASIVSNYCSVENTQRLGIKSEGAQAVEGFMISQEQMLGAVYWNEHNRAVTAMFHAAIANIVVRDVVKLEELVSRLKACGTERDAIRNVLVPEINAMQKGKPGSQGLLPLLELHSEPQFTSIYVSIRKYTNLDEPPTRSGARQSIYASILGPTHTTTASFVPIEWKAVQSLRKCYMEAFREKNGTDVGAYDILIDVPFGKTSNRVIKVRYDSEERPITDSSHLKDTIFTEPTAFLAPIRVYVSPAVEKEYRQHLESIIITAEERFYNL